MSRIDVNELMDDAGAADPEIRAMAQAAATVLIAAALRALLGVAMLVAILLAAIVGILLAK